MIEYMPERCMFNTLFAKGHTEKLVAAEEVCVSKEKPVVLLALCVCRGCDISMQVFLNRPPGLM